MRIDVYLSKIHINPTEGEQENSPETYNAHIQYSAHIGIYLEYDVNLTWH